jgi:hypothetical protein
MTSTPLDDALERVAQQLSAASGRKIEDCRDAVTMAAHTNRVLVMEYRWWSWLERRLTKLIDWMTKKRRPQ